MVGKKQDNIFSPSALYEAGFDLLEQGKFKDCLCLWQQIPSDDTQFLSQKEVVIDQLIQDVAKRLAERPLERIHEIQEVLRELTECGLELTQLGKGEVLNASHRFLSLIMLWQEGRVREIRTISGAADFLHPTVLEIHAKSSYIVLKEEGRLATMDEVGHFIDCWLSFLSHSTLFRSPEQPDDAEKYCLDLLEVGEKMVRKYAEHLGGTGEQLLFHWEEDYVLLKAFSSFFWKEENVPLYTPALAWEAGIAEQIFKVIQNKQDAVLNQEEFLAAGALYSAVGPTLLLVRRKQYDAASKDFFSFKKRKRVDEHNEPCLSYGLAQVGLACGLFFLEEGRYEEAVKVFVSLLPLPLNSSKMRQTLLVAFEREDRFFDPDWLTAAVQVVSEVHKHHPVQEVKKALCSILTHQAVLLHNAGSIDVKVLITSMEKAIKLNPEDEFARMTFDDVRMDAEIHSLHQTMSSGQLDKASRIAKKSLYPEVVNQFFLFVAQVVEQVEGGDYPDDTSAFFMLQQLFEGALNVNPAHGMIQELALLLDELEERLENL